MRPRVCMPACAFVDAADCKPSERQAALSRLLSVIQAVSGMYHLRALQLQLCWAEPGRQRAPALHNAAGVTQPPRHKSSHVFALAVSLSLVSHLLHLPGSLILPGRA